MKSHALIKNLDLKVSLMKEFFERTVQLNLCLTACRISSPSKYVVPEKSAAFLALSRLPH